MPPSVTAWVVVPLGSRRDGEQLRAVQSPAGDERGSRQLWVPLGILRLEPPPSAASAWGEHVGLLMK